MLEQWKQSGPKTAYLQKSPKLPSPHHPQNVFVLVLTDQSPVIWKKVYKFKS